MVRRHPLMSARVRRNWRGQLIWEQAEGFKPAIEWRQGRQDSGWPLLAPIDLEKAPGFRLFAVEDPGWTDLVLQVHHSLHDGAGTFAVVDDLLAIYARDLGATVNLAELHPERLPTRNKFGLSLRDKLRLLPFQLVGLALSLQLHRRKVAPLLPAPDRAAPDDGPLPPNLPAVASRSFSPEEFRDLREAAKYLGTGMHDLFIRDTQAALGAWLKVHGKGGPLDWVRLLIPCNLRRPVDFQLPAANLVSLVIIDRRAKSLANRERLLRRVREDMNWVKRKRLGYVFLVLLGLRRLWPGGIRRYARRPVCRATFFLTNVGDIFHNSPLRNPEGKLAVPGAILEDVCLVGPYRPGTCACLAIGLYAQRLSANLQYDPGVMTQAQAEDLVQAFADQVKLTVESAG